MRQKVIPNQNSMMLSFSGQSENYKLICHQFRSTTKCNNLLNYQLRLYGALYRACLLPKKQMVQM